jgi:AraC-like DNA-binding protein
MSRDDSVAHRDRLNRRRAWEAFMSGTSVLPRSYHTTDVDTARDHVARTFADHDLSMAGVRDLNFQLDVAPSSRITLGQMCYGADVSLVGPPMRLCYHVNLPVTGRTVVAQNGDRRTSAAGETGVAFLPDGPLAIRWSPDAVQYVIKFPKELLEAQAAKLAGCPVGEIIRFDLTFDLTSPAGQALIATAGFLYAELARPGGLARIPAACHEMESALMTQLLMVVPSQLSRVLNGGPARSRQAKIRQVMDYIDANPGADASTAELAAKAGISARALQVGFHDVVGMSPSAYVRGVRLDRVHLELLSGQSGSVTEAAGRWGFFHPGRFASQYRDRFGVLPSETARVAADGS